MNYHEVDAPAPLDHWVRCFWFLMTDVDEPQAIVPDGRIEIVVHRAAPFGEVVTGGTVRRQSPEVVSGQLTRPIIVRPTGPADVIGIRFRTAGARDLLRLPLGELRDQVVPLSELAPGLVAAIEGAANDGDPVRSITAVLLDRVSGSGRPAGAEPVARLARGESVAHVARTLAVSIRTLERRVRDECGLPPKLLQRVMRFRTLYALLRASPGNGAKAAALAGYFDQTHANRDFHQFVGCSPKEHFALGPELAQAFLSHSY